MDKLTVQLAEALRKAEEHLDFCGYGDRWEYECAKETGLEKMIKDALKAYDEAAGYTMITVGDGEYATQCNFCGSYVRNHGKEDVIHDKSCTRPKEKL